MATNQITSQTSNKLYICKSSISEKIYTTKWLNYSLKDLSSTFRDNKLLVTRTLTSVACGLVAYALAPTIIKTLGETKDPKNESSIDPRKSNEVKIVEDKLGYGTSGIAGVGILIIITGIALCALKNRSRPVIKKLQEATERPLKEGVTSQDSGLTKQNPEIPIPKSQSPVTAASKPTLESRSLPLNSLSSKTSKNVPIEPTALPQIDKSCPEIHQPTTYFPFSATSCALQTTTHTSELNMPPLPFCEPSSDNTASSPETALSHQNQNPGVNSLTRQASASDNIPKIDESALVKVSDKTNKLTLQVIKKICKSNNDFLKSAQFKDSSSSHVREEITITINSHLAACNSQDDQKILELVKDILFTTSRLRTLSGAIVQNVYKKAIYIQNDIDEFENSTYFPGNVLENEQFKKFRQSEIEEMNSLLMFDDFTFEGMVKVHEIIFNKIKKQAKRDLIFALGPHPKLGVFIDKCQSLMISQRDVSQRDLLTIILLTAKNEYAEIKNSFEDLNPIQRKIKKEEVISHLNMLEKCYTSPTNALSYLKLPKDGLKRDALPTYNSLSDLITKLDPSKAAKVDPHQRSSQMLKEALEAHNKANRDIYSFVTSKKNEPASYSDIADRVLEESRELNRKVALQSFKAQDRNELMNFLKNKQEELFTSFQNIPLMESFDYKKTWKDQNLRLCEKIGIQTAIKQSGFGFKFDLENAELQIWAECITIYIKHWNQIFGFQKTKDGSSRITEERKVG